MLGQTPDTYNRLSAAVDHVRSIVDREHAIGLVLGSGMGSYAADIDGAVAIPYTNIPGLPAVSVAGHGGTLYSFERGGQPVLAFSGRVHAYEGHAIEDVVFGVRMAGFLGVRSLVMTNAAGAVGEHLHPGDLAVIVDHLNLAGLNPLVGANDDRLGFRFPDVSELYALRLRNHLRAAFETAGVAHKEGVYAWFLGPTYETPAEVRMAATLGADLVGMSTVPEAIAAHHMGIDVAAISLVTNYAAGRATDPLSHDEVTETADRAAGTLRKVLDAFLSLLAAG